jgi:hypothetical protein
MIKMKIIYTIFALLCFNLSFTQTVADVGRIVLNCTVIDNDKKIPEEASMLLISKLQQIATNSGLGGNSINPRFVLAVKPNVTTKDIIAGPPQMVSLNLELVFFIGDALENLHFSSQNLNVKGVGVNENKAYINAIQSINPRNRDFSAFLTIGKEKIIQYFENNCEIIHTKVKGLTETQEYDAAIYELMQIPDVSMSCYNQAMSEIKLVFGKKIEKDGQIAYQQALNKWTSNQTTSGATLALEILGKIDPLATSYKEAVILSQSIKRKLSDDEQKEWDFKMRSYNDEIEMNKKRNETARQIAIEYYKNQPKTIIYNRLIW